ncbi:MAG: aldehyde dehydrogenase family protein [Bacteroidia bacterium]|nr:aldehyde dehydrogenase family protein [Bacteroidia bacterium]
MISSDTREFGSLIGGAEVFSGRWLPVISPWSGQQTGRISHADPEQVQAAIEAAAPVRLSLSRYERSQILNRMADHIMTEIAPLGRMITDETGLSLQDTQYEVIRVADVLRFAAIGALQDDSEVYPCDITAQGRNRRIYTMRQPLRLISAITPFNHPMNQVAHKIAPAIATNNKVILKPSEKTPLSAYYFARLAYDCGLPPEALTVVNGDVPALAPLLTSHPDITLVSFTGSSAIGKQIAREAGYKKLVLELGGSSVMIIMDDYDPEAAADIAVSGIFKNSGQRCTCIRRFLVQAGIADRFAEALAARAAALRCDDPYDPDTQVGTVISGQAAISMEEKVKDAVGRGATLLTGNIRDGALYRPTVVDHLQNHFPLVSTETFGPIASILRFNTLDEAIRIANDTPYGLSGAVVTHRWDVMQRVITELETGTVNVNEAPSYRLEWSPFGGIKDSGLGYKEGVLEAMKAYTYLKTYSLPWDRP